MSQRGLTGARRTIENHRAKAIGLEHAAQELARSEKMFLTDEILDRARPHPRGQRLGLA
jgi:hypothetical protein